MEQHDLCAALIEAWGQVFADYQKARIHNETDLMISLAKHLEKKHDDGMVVAESLIQLEAASKAQKHPDLIWAKVITGRAVKKDDVRKAEALAVIELKYEHFPKAKIDTDKLQHFQNYMTESRNPVAKAGFNWSRTYTEIRLGADTLMVLGLVGRQDEEINAESWKVFDCYRRPIPSWAWLDQWSEQLKSSVLPQLSELASVLRKSDRALELFGGDPSRFDRSSFRPLRLSREEDWSDWLVELLSNPLFLGAVLDIEPPEMSKVQFRREIAVKPFRADILILVGDRNLGYHIEVKLWDTYFEKTYPTANSIESYFRREVEWKQVEWKHFILLPKEALYLWETVNTADKKNHHVQALLWNQLCLALRKCLLLEATLHWKVWAHTYVSCIEQRILGFSPIPENTEAAPATILTLMNQVLYSEYLSMKGASS